MPSKRENLAVGARRISLKELARHLSLSPTALSLVLNDAPAASSIPQETKDRIWAAAREFDYRPNYLARSLRAQRTYTIGVLLPEVSGGYSATVLSGIESELVEKGYFFLIASHRHDARRLGLYRDLLIERRVEGLIAVDTPCAENSPLPVVAISRHEDLPGVTNVILDHDHAAYIALTHLRDLGHRNIAVIKGQIFSSDTEIRWQAIVKAAHTLGLTINPSAVAQMAGNSPSPELGYLAMQQILAAGAHFTALFSFNDVSALGAMRALQDAGRRVPDDVSVIGFDDIDAAAFHNPTLTTVRQPLEEMGRCAAKILLQRIGNPHAPWQKTVTVAPSLTLRQSAARKAGSRQ